MTEPQIVDRKPVVMDLEPGNHAWCSCGYSSNQPFCDGSHKGTDFTPVRFKIEETQKASLCLCKHTQNAPFCDGTHRQLPESADG